MQNYSLEIKLDKVINFQLQQYSKNCSMRNEKYNEVVTPRDQLY